MRRTKIIATIGPASRDPDILDGLIAAGMDCARLNFSHGELSEHAEVIRTVRRLAEKHGRRIPVLQDLGGIKLRLGELAEPAELSYGDEVTLSPEPESSRPDVLPFPHPDVLENIQPGHRVFIADGTVCLEVLASHGRSRRARVVDGGIVTSHKGVNLPGVRIDLPVLTEQDKTALRFGVAHEVDWVAVSFVRTAEDIRYTRAYMKTLGGQIPLMAKLERREAIDNIEEILKEVEGVMVARGDLGVEIPMEQVPGVQKVAVRKANEAAKLSCIATQMLRSMVVSPTPTRAEVSDITNAVLDGCDAILLSEEIAVGRHPVEAVRVADATIREAEKMYPYDREWRAADRTQAIASSASRLARSLGAKPIVVTSTGRAAFELSRYRPDSDILVFSHEAATLRRLCLGWGLCPVGFIPPERDIAKLVSLLIEASLETGLVVETDVVVIVHGFLTGVSGTTNTIQVLDVREHLARSSENADPVR